VQTIGAVLSSSSRYHSEITKDYENNENIQTTKDDQSGVESNVLEIGGRNDTG
jgi:hypothetical protein